MLTLTFPNTAIWAQGRREKNLCISALCSLRKGNWGRRDVVQESQPTARDSSNYFPIKAWCLDTHSWDQDSVTVTTLHLLSYWQNDSSFSCKGHTARGCLPFNISHSIKPISRLDFPAHLCHWLLIYPTASRTPSNDSSACQPFVFFNVNDTQYLSSSLCRWIIHCHTGGIFTFDKT